MRTNSGYRRRTTTAKAFTLIELMVVIAIIALLLGILVPALGAARAAARRAQCGTSLRSISQGLTIYEDRIRHLPQRFNDADPSRNWGYDDELMWNETATRKIFVCPDHSSNNYNDATVANPSYGMNWYYDNSKIPLAMSDTIAAAETAGDTGQGSHRADRDSGPPGQLDPRRHSGKANYVYFDAHVEYASYDDASASDKHRWGIDQGKHTEGSIWPAH
jgi:prepilin-type N-terminal cleavage/methylation domain-containing protein/prepilin-type processing-associated H-X9-DG protein